MLTSTASWFYLGIFASSRLLTATTPVLPLRLMQTLGIVVSALQLP